MSHHHHHHHHRELTGAELSAVVFERLQAQGMRLTAPRRQLVDMLAQAGAPLVFDTLLERLGAAFDRVTLYRNLSAFEAAGVLQCVRDAQDKTRYELTAPHDHHHHVVCRNCGHVECLPQCDIDGFTRQAEALGYLVQEHRVEVYGLCPACRK